jgi:prepilin-type N-terminal cleavage/methylation domain-containing protein
MNSSKRAFNLIEIIIVMSIIAILSAITGPAISNYSPGWRLSNASRSILYDIRQAQEETVTSQIQHLVRFYPATNPPYYELIKNESTETGFVETVIEKTELKGVSISLEDSFLNDTVYQVSFSPDGGPNTSGNITVSVESMQKIINISAAGVIKIL